MSGARALVQGSAPTAVRGATLVLIAVELLTGARDHGSARTTQLVCFVVGTLTVIAWGVLSWRRTAQKPAGDDDRLTGLFIVMAAASVGSTTAHGGALISFALLAAVAAGAGSALVAGLAVAGVGVLAVVIGAVSTSTSAVSTLGNCLMVVVALLIGRSRHSYRVQAAQAALLLAQAGELRTEQARVATLTERARIAREIHDVLAHSLGALGIQIQTARVVLSEQHDAAQAQLVLERAQRIATEGLDETRRAVQALRSDRLPLEDELAALAVTHQAVHDVRVELQVDGEVQQLAPDTALALLRTAQEALVNAAKHSPHQPITMTLTYDPGQTHLRVSNPLLEPDAGRGAVPTITTVDGGYGLIGMRERLLLLHGSLTASARAGLWEVTALVPR